MRQSILLTAVLGALSFAQVSYAADEAKPAASDWTVTGNIGFASDYRFRGMSQTWKKPAVQGGFDISHKSGFYAGVWGSNVSPNTYPDANVELDLYGGYNGSISAVEGLGYTVGLYGYFYPNGSWGKYRDATGTRLTPGGGSWNTYEANFGVSYNWLSAKVSVTLGDWFGAESKTGWDGGTSGTTYMELNAAYPLPIWDLTLVGHVGRLNVSGRLDPNAPLGASASTSGATNPDYTDYKVGLSKAFKIASSEGWNAGVYYVGANNTRYWGDRGYGGASFNGAGMNDNGVAIPQQRNLNEGAFVFTINRTF